MSNATATNEIDITPTWRAAMDILIAVVADGTAEGRKLACDELRQLADKLDSLQAKVKAVKQYDQAMCAAERAPDGDDYNAVLSILRIR